MLLSYFIIFEVRRGILFRIVILDGIQNFRLGTRILDIE